MKMIKRWLLLIVVVVAAWVPQRFLIAQAPQGESTIENALLTTPDKCGSPCVWTFQPRVQTLTDFRPLAIILVPSAAERPLLEVGQGVNARGVTLQAFTRFINDPDPIAEFISVRLLPSVAQSADVSIANFTPAAMIQALGNPDEVYLLFSKQNINRTHRYRLILKYTGRSAAYIINGKFRDGKACLTPEDAETLTLYRFGGEEGMTQYFQSILASGPANTPTIRETTNQTPSDFVRMAQNPATDCLTLK